MKTWKKLLSLVLVGALAFSFTACRNAKKSDSGSKGKEAFRTLDQIKKSGTINIGVFSDKNPFGYVDENGEYQGYDIYLANRLGKDLGVKVNFVSTEAANRIEYLQTGKVDVILANFTVTDERKEEVDFALPYMNVALGVVSPSDKVVKSLDNWNAKDQLIVISKLGDNDTIAPAVTKGNKTVLKWLNDEIKSLGDEKFFHKDYEETLVDTYGTEYEEELVIEGGQTK